MMAISADCIIGQKFGMLTVVKEVSKYVMPCGQTQRGFLCKCDCGKKSRVRLQHLRRGMVKSCGCLNKETHGLTNHPLYNTWRGIRERTIWKSNPRIGRKYRDDISRCYISKGVTLCKQWDRFANFYKWAMANGWREGLTIDRINNNGGYSPSNCRFVTQRENSLNRDCTIKVVYDGRTVALMVLLDEMGMADRYKTIHCRIRRGWTPKDAIDTPTRQGNYRRKSAL